MCVGRAAPGFLQHPFSKQPSPSAWLSPSLSLFLSHTGYFTVVFCPKRLASEWSSLPAHWTQPRNSYEYEGFLSMGLKWLLFVS